MGYWDHGGLVNGKKSKEDSSLVDGAAAVGKVGRVHLSNLLSSDP